MNAIKNNNNEKNEIKPDKNTNPIYIMKINLMKN